MKITEYIILEDITHDSMRGMVASYIRDGWQPAGGLHSEVVEVYEDGRTRLRFYQAMVK